MYPLLSSSRLSKPITAVVVFISPVLLISLPICGAEDIKRYYSDCSKSFGCGKQNISYPFWGGGRPQYCGVEGFNVRCEEEDFLVINMGPQEFHVLDINQSTRAIRLQRIDVVNACRPPVFSTAEWNEELFDYGQETEEIYLFYDCWPIGLNISVDKYSIRNTFKCKSRGGNMEHVVYFGKEDFRKANGDLESCNVKDIKVPVDRKVVKEFSNNVTMEVQDLLKASFVVYYRINNETACSENLI